MPTPEEIKKSAKVGYKKYNSGHENNTIFSKRKG
jgi:hypothetical protein